MNRVRTAPLKEQQELINVIDITKASASQSGNRRSLISDPWGLGSISGYNEPSSQVKMSYALLKRMARTPIVAAILRTRINQMRMFTTPVIGPVRRGSVPMGFRIKHRSKHESKYTRVENNYAEELTHFITNMGNTPRVDVTGKRRRPAFGDFLAMIAHDALIYDQGCAEKIFARGGKLLEAWPVDGSTIRIATPGSKAAYVQVIAAMPKVEFSIDELLFWVRWPRTDLDALGYGYGELEDMITTITAHLNAEQFNRKIFSQGTSVKGILNLKGDIDEDTLKDFRAQWRQMTTGLQSAWKTPVLKAKEGVEFINMSPTNREMEYSKWMEYLVKVACAIFQIDPAEINFDLRGSSGQKPMFESSPEARLKQSKDKGLRPLIKSTQDEMNEEIMDALDPEWMLEFIGMDDVAESEVIDQRNKEVSNYKTVDEVREEVGLEQLGEEAGGTLILNPQYITAMGQKAQAAAMGGGGGEVGGEGEGEFGTDYTYEDEESTLPEPEGEEVLEEEPTQKAIDINESIISLSESEKQSMMNIIKTIIEDSKQGRSAHADILKTVMEGIGSVIKRAVDGQSDNFRLTLEQMNKQMKENREYKDTFHKAMEEMHERISEQVDKTVIGQSKMFKDALTGLSDIMKAVVEGNDKEMKIILDNKPQDINMNLNMELKQDSKTIKQTSVSKRQDDGTIITEIIKHEEKTNG